VPPSSLELVLEQEGHDVGQFDGGFLAIGEARDLAAAHQGQALAIWISRFDYLALFKPVYKGALKFKHCC